MYHEREERPAGAPDPHASEVSGSAPAESLELRLLVREPDLLRALLAHPEGRARDEFALSALRIGILSLEQARGAVDSRAVRDEVERLLESLGSALTGHRDALRLQTETVLKDYFDPQSGRFAERVERLTKDDGELASVLRRHLAADDSTLARTLTAHLGHESPLLRLVDPKNAEGLVASLRSLVSAELDAQRERILAQFSLDQEGSALKRLVTELTEHHGKVSGDLKEQIGAVTGEFSLDNADSALSRLVGRVEQAQRQITSEFDLNAETSALARLRRELLGIAEKQERSLIELGQRVDTELQKLAVKRETEQRTTLGGLAFEDSFCGWLEHAVRGSSDVAERTGNRTGLIKLSKVGDATLELGPEQQAAGARIVFEAKEVSGYSLVRAREEIDEARRNRGASVGVFVFSRRTAPAHLPSLHRIGNDVFVVWDADDASSDLQLEAALAVARALAFRAGAARHEAVDLEKLDRAIRAVEKQAEGLDEIRKSAETIASGSHKILERVRILGEALGRAVGDLDGCSEAVKRALLSG